MDRIERYEIRIAGFGGQGVVTVGKVLGIAATVFEGKNSVNTQSYGPESRGGACKSEVVISSGKINYPYVRKADVFIALSQLAFATYFSGLKEEGILIIDPNAVRNLPEMTFYRMYEVPTATIAHEIGNIKYQNSVALGALYPLLKALIKKTSLTRALKEIVPPKTRKANIAAFEKGSRYLEDYYKVKG